MTDAAQPAPSGDPLNVSAPLDNVVPSRPRVESAEEEARRWARSTNGALAHAGNGESDHGTSVRAAGPERGDGAGMSTLPGSQGVVDEEPIEVELGSDELNAFAWDPAYIVLLRTLSEHGRLPKPLPDHLPSPSAPSWSTLRLIFLYRLRSIFRAYLLRGSSGLFDTREEPRSSGGWVWGSAEVKREFEGVADALLDFEAGSSLSAPSSGSNSVDDGTLAAPFTLQRLAELLVVDVESTPPSLHPHYRTLPKYVRAFNRVLAVTSPLSSFPLDTFELSDPAHDAAVDAEVVHINGFTIATPSPSPSPSPTASPALRSRRSSSMTPAPSLLEPIPWLINNPQRHDPSITAQGHDVAPGTATGGLGLADVSNGVHVGSSAEPPPLAALSTDGVPPSSSSSQLSPPLGSASNLPRSAALSPPRTSLNRALSPDAPGAGGRVDEVDAGLGTSEELTGGPVAVVGELSPRVGPTTVPGEGKGRERESLSPGPDLGEAKVAADLHGEAMDVS